MNDDEENNFNSYVSENCDFDTESFGEFKLDYCDDLIEDDWWFENETDGANYKNMNIPDDFYDLLDYIENEIGYSIQSVNYKISDGGLNVTEIDGIEASISGGAATSTGMPVSNEAENEDREDLINIAEYNNNVNVRKFLSQYQELGRPTGQLDEQLIMLGFGTKGFSITQEDYDGESQEDEWFRDLLCDTILTLKMEVGEIRVLGPCEVRCVFVQQISQRNENDVTEVVNFYIVEFQCDTILLAIYGWYDEQEFLSEYSKIISSEGVHRTSYTGYLSEMTEDLQAIDT
jgi:hypothetical protein